jgi:hypothetical protein
MKLRKALANKSCGRGRCQQIFTALISIRVDFKHQFNNERVTSISEDSQLRQSIACQAVKW